MSALAAVYVNEIANGNVPDPKSPEAVEYRKWSREETVKGIVKESAIKVYGSAYYLLGSMV
jgi:hypothetical protein